MGAGSRDVIAVWILEGVIFVGNKRIYEFEYNEGFVIEEWEWYDFFDNDETLNRDEWSTNAKSEANELATRISSQAKMPVMANWGD